MKKFSIYFSLFLIGFTALVSQIIFARVFLVIFNGNELSIKFILASWFIWGFIGSYVIGKHASKFNNKFKVFNLCQILLTIFLPIILLLLKHIRLIFNTNIGQIITSSPLILSSCFILAPVCILLSFMFVLGTTLLKDKPISTVYILEAVGAALGGILVNFVLLNYLSSIHIIIILSFLNILGSIIFNIYNYNNKKSNLLLSISITLFILFSLVSASGLWTKLDDYLLERRFLGYEIKTAKNSIYGEICIVKRQNQHSFFYNGLHIYSIPDIITQEEISHLSLLEHPNPKEILLIGGHGGTLISEILKHNVNNIVYTELDPRVIKLTEDIMPNKYSKFLKHEKVSIKHIDARLYVSNTNSKFDVIIVNLTHPSTLQLNRYYTAEFLNYLKLILSDNGIVSFSIESSVNYINPELKTLLNSLYHTFKYVFNDVKVIPGNTLYFLASKNTEVLTYNFKTLVKRSKDRSLNLNYVREDYLFLRFSEDRLNYIKNILNSFKNYSLNYDFKPISYYYNTLFQMSYFKKDVSLKFVSIIFIISIIIILLFVFLNKKRSFRDKTIIASVMTTGFSEISFQIIVLVSFQIIYGYMFHKLGIIFATFMLGLGLGSYFYIKSDFLKKDIITFRWTQFTVCLYPLILPILLMFLSKTKGVFTFLPLIAGFIGGFQFPLANHLIIKKNSSLSNSIGITYGIDLIGACLGSVLVGSLFIPVFGIFYTCISISFLNLFVLLLLFF